MPDVSIALSAKDKVSSILKKVGQVSGQTADEIDKLQDSLDTLSAAKVNLKTNLDKVRQQVSEARKEFRKLGDSVSEQNYKDKLSELEKLEQQYYAVSKSIRMVENEETSLAGTRSKLANREAGGSTGSMFGSLGSALATAGFGNMLSGSLSGAAGAFFSSYYGSTEGAAVESFLGSAISGASMGASAGMMVGGPAAAGIGAAVGGLIGAVSGGIEAATQQFESRDKAFKSYVQDQYNAVQERQAADLESGSALASQRETDLVSFTTLFGSKDTAQQYLNQLKTMANVTPFLYSDLTAMSKTLKTYGYAANEMIPALTSIGDAGAALGMTAADMTNVSTALGRMRSSNKTTLEDLNILQDRGIDAVGALANAKGVSKGGAYEMISDGDIAGTEAAQIIQSYMEQMYAGAMEQQSKTFEGLSSTLEGWNQELQNAMGEGYNEGKKIGMSDQIDWLEGESGQKMMEMNEQLGRFKADAENLQQDIYQDVFNGMFNGEIPADMDAKIAAQVEDLHQRYMNAMATIESSASSEEEVFAAGEELAMLKGAAEELAYNTYMTSDAADTMTAANIALADSIAAGAGDAYENAGYSVSEKLTQGITRHINSYTPPPIKVPVLYESVSTSGGIAAGVSVRTSVGTTTGSHLTGATSPYRAIGENRVPRDNTLYLLHEGERVLTAREARAQDQGGTGGVVINMGGNYTVRQDSDISAIAEAVAARILRARRIVRT
ncbi:tape measure protein [Agathobaculum sp. Marseille-P7918]|uniref:tape measure protein n=1 Tax=Agathobaculum sp. Marseille-P7918 TaxID=2479843 RepID=UPI000F62FDE0|nr:tape measure protein [Agathobaculum sp. Marseille-P7918]